MNVFTKSLGLFDNQDVVSLAEGLVLENNFLVDLANSARHQIRPDRVPLFMDLRRPVRLADWIGTNRLCPEEDMLKILIFLDDIAGLNVRRHFSGNFRIWLQRLGFRLKGSRIAWNSRRFKGGRGVFGALNWAMLPLVLAVAVSCVLAYGANVNAKAFVSYQLIFLVTLYVSALAHEYVHWFFAKHSSQFVVRGLRIGLIHHRLSGSKEILSGILGPTSGCFVCFAALLLIGSVSYASVSVVAIGIFHLLSLLPFFGDGAAIINNRRAHA